MADGNQKTAEWWVLEQSILNRGLYRGRKKRTQRYKQEDSQMGLQKLIIRNLDNNETLKCLFNPTEYTVSKTNSWQPKPVVGKNVPRLDFTGGAARTLTVQLFFDVFEAGGDVRDHTRKLESLTLIDPNKKRPDTRRSRPPFCIVEWGQNWSFKAAITSLSIRYTLFKEDGTPVRATADVSFQELEDENEQPGTNPTSFSEPGHKRREVRVRDTLALIAFEEYGNANLWRFIADANDLDDPFSIHAGQLLAIPPLS